MEAGRRRAPRRTTLGRPRSRERARNRARAPERPERPAERPAVAGTPAGSRLRAARSRDLATLVRHRRAMWEDIGGRSPAELAEHDVRYRAWAAPKLRRGEILGLIAEDRRRHALASGVVWLREGQPRPGSVARREPYLMSMFTEPRARGRGLASAIVREFARLLEGRGFPRIELHASVEGRPVYERLGFTRTYEMRLWFDPERARAERRRRRLATRRFREARGGALRGAPARPGVRRGRAA